MMRWWCRLRGHHRWLMGRSVGEFIETPDVCLTCGERIRRPALGEHYFDGTGPTP